MKPPDPNLDRTTNGTLQQAMRELGYASAPFRRAMRGSPDYEKSKRLDDALTAVLRLTGIEIEEKT